jgi:hypothetical protein
MRQGPVSGDPAVRGASQRRRWLLVSLAGLIALGLFAGWLTTRHGDFGVGDSRDVTVVVGDCWRAEIEIGGRRWVAPSSQAAPSSWGQGPEAGSLTRLSVDEAVFRARDGQEVEMYGTEFHDAACPLSGRPS